MRAACCHLFALILAAPLFAQVRPADHSWTAVSNDYTNTLVKVEMKHNPESGSRQQSSSMRSPLFHCRRMVANVCGALPSVKGLPFTATVAPSVHAGIRRCPANSAGFDEETSNCRALSNGISTFLRQPNPRVGDGIHARQRRHPLAERGGGSEPPSVFAEFPRIVGFSRLSSLNPISIACVSRSCLSWRSLVRVTSP